jgi:hypothetical protein
MRTATPSPSIWVSTRRLGFLFADLAEEALTGPEHGRGNLQPQLVDEVVLDQRAQELEAAGEKDFPAEPSGPRARASRCRT